MTSLLRLLRHRSDALEADLLERGIDLLDHWRGTLTLRRLLVLYRWLPEASAVRRWERGTEWTVAHDIADLHRRAYLSANGVKDPPAHPAAPPPAPPELSPQRQAAIARAKAIRDDRARRIESGELT